MENETFIGSTVQVFVEEPARGGMLEDVYVRQLAGRDYIVGKLAPHNPADQRAGLETWCAIEHVQMLIVFPDLASAQRYWEMYKRDKEASGRKKRRWWRR